MAFYKELNGILNLGTSMLLSNENICKLVHYYPQQVDYQYDPLAQDEVKNPSSLLMENIFPLPKIPDADTKQNCFIDVTVCGGEEVKDNPKYRRILIMFDIICHLDAWIIKNGFRPISIMEEIDSMFNLQRTPLDIINKPIARPFIPKDYSNKFYGFQLSYEMIVNSNIECI